MEVRIGRCRVEDIDDVVRFIDAHWKVGHVLAACRSLLDWQHRDPDGDGYSFVVARRPGDRDVLGILGYIPTRRFDPALDADNVVWLTTWKVREDADVAGLGLLLLRHLTTLEPHVAVGALGLSPSTVPLLRALGYRVGELDHYVRPTAAHASARLATLASGPRPLARVESPLDACRLARDDEFEAFRWTRRDEVVPRKSSEYFRTRYARHPLYRYLVVGLLDGGAPAGLLAARPATHDGRCALRVVDAAGSDEVLSRIGPLVDALVEELGAEYADLYNTGTDPRVFERAGFTRVDPTGPDVVPDHFEPFERRNVRLWYALKGPRPGALFKGDADQDRPNRASPPC